MDTKLNEKKEILLELYEDFNNDRLKTLMDLRDDLDEACDKSKSYELMNTICDGLIKFVDQTKNWSNFDKMSWFVKEAFVMGYLQATEDLLSADIE